MTAPYVFGQNLERFVADRSNSLTEFTQGQMIRAFGIWPLFRIAQNPVTIASSAADLMQSTAATLSSAQSSPTPSLATADQSFPSTAIPTQNVGPTALSDLGQFIQNFVSAQIGDALNTVHVTMTPPAPAPTPTANINDAFDGMIPGLPQAPGANAVCGT